MPTSSTDLLQGTLDLLILRTLDREPLHGWAIARSIQRLSRDVLTVQQGSLYPALYRLQDRGLLAASWADSEVGRRVKVYRLTAKGSRRLEEELASWRRLSAGVESVLQAT